MAYNDSKKHFIKITPEFLFDEYSVFKSKYTPWVYMYLKFKFNYFLQHNPDKRFRIPTEEITGFLFTTPSTISRAIKELAQKGFLEKFGQIYKIKDDKLYIEKFKPIASNDFIFNYSNYPEFLKVYYEQIDRMRFRFSERIREEKKSPEFFIKLIETLFYLNARNRHCLLEDEKMIASKECNRSLSIALNHDNRTTTDILKILESAGYIKLGKDTKISTINIYFKEEEKVQNVSYFEDDNFEKIYENSLKCEEEQIQEEEYEYEYEY